MKDRHTQLLMGSVLLGLFLFGWLWWDTGVKLGQYSAGIQANAENIAANKQHLEASRKMVLDGQVSIEQSVKNLADRDKLLSNLLEELKKNHIRQDRILLLLERKMDGK